MNFSTRRNSRGLCDIAWRGSVVGIATRYGLDGPVIDSQWVRGGENPHSSIPALGATQPPVRCLPGHSQGVNRLRRGVDNPPTSNTDVKERVELHL